MGRFASVDEGGASCAAGKKGELGSKAALYELEEPAKGCEDGAGWTEGGERERRRRRLRVSRGEVSMKMEEEEEARERAEESERKEVKLA